MPRGVAHDYGQDHHAEARDEGVPEQQAERREHDEQHQDLAELHPDVKRQEREQEVRTSELEVLLEGEGEAEPVHETEGAGDEPAPA